jgi:DNA topoisomerase IB
MKTTTWKREAGYVSVVLFANKKSAAVSTKTYSTQKGAEKANEKLATLCGENYENANLPWTVTDPKTGVISRLYRNENLLNI